MEDTSSVSQQIVTQLLLMMDDVRRDNQLGNNKFVFIIGATNLPEVGFLIRFHCSNWILLCYVLEDWTC